MNIEAIRTADGISLKGLFLETKEQNMFIYSWMLWKLCR